MFTVDQFLVKINNSKKEGYKMLQDRTVLEQNLTEVIKTAKLKRKSKNNEEIKKHLAENYQIFDGDVQSWLNNPEIELPNLDIRVLYLLAEQVYAKTGAHIVNPKLYFTENEITEARQYSGILEQKENKLNFPITIPNVTVVGNSAYLATLDIQLINKLIENQLLNYNFELQREARFVKRKNEIIIEPTLKKKNVKEITEHLLQGTLVPTMLVFNAATKTAKSGTELIYDPKNMELTITEGTRLDIVDGYHRCKASQNALKENPDLHFNFAVLITNYSTRRAQQYQAQLAKATPISRVRIQELEANRLADTVVQELREESDLKGRISQTNRIHMLGRELVSYNVLADTIDEKFSLETRADAADVAEYLTEFFNFLLDAYKNEFIDNPNETRKYSLINDNNMFVGYVTLASRMYEKKIKPKEVVKYIKDIDFRKDNPLWKELGILNEKGNINDNTVQVRKAIKRFFENIELK